MLVLSALVESCRAWLRPRWIVLGGLVLLWTVVRAEVLEESPRRRVCLERIWHDYERCRERQREHLKYGRFGSSFSFGSSDVFHSKYKVECCSYWELLECAHKSAQIYCSNDDLNLKSLDRILEEMAIQVPLYVCHDEYPKGSFRCKMPSLFAIIVGFLVIAFLVLVFLLFICIRTSK